MQAYIIDLLQKKYRRANWFDLQVRAISLRVPCLLFESILMPALLVDQFPIPFRKIVGS